METMSVADLRTFVAIARSTSLTQAAASLGVQKAAVSKALARLEAQLGARLVERTTRRVAITEPGAHLARRAQAILEELDELGAEIASDRDELRGSLSLAASPEAGAAIVERLVARFLERHPRVRVAVSLGYELHDLFDPRYDVAFRIGAVRDESLVARRVGGFRRVLVAAPALLARSPRLSRPADLARVPCVVFGEHDTHATWTLEASAGRSERVDVEGPLCARSYRALLAAARAGLGVANVPEMSVTSELAQGELVRVLPRWASPELPIFLAHRAGRHRVRRVAALVALLEEDPSLVPGGRPRRARAHGA